jgi:AAHS family 4-hydroxybenzoate transporter-like MFS transporter
LTSSGKAIRVDVASLIDDRPISALQLRVFVFCALVAVLDGVDSQAIAVAGPLIRTQLGVSAVTFAWAFSAGLFGAAIGAILFGPIADRIGRKPTLVSATALFGIFTCLTALASDCSTLLLYRSIAGLGLGGAIPCFITLAAEYAPARRRAMFTSLLWAGYPLGNAVGGFMSSFVITHFEWPAVFYAGGVPTLGVALVLLFLVPESVRFLASRGINGSRTERLIRALDPTLPAGPIEASHVEEAPSRTKIPLADLFTNGRAAGTALLGSILFLAFATTTVIVLQVPTLLREANVPLQVSAILTGVYSIVAVFGMAIAGRLVEKFGSVAALAPAFVCGAGLLAALGYFASSPFAAAIVMALLGVTVPLGASGGIALTANFYPTAMRSAGTGWAMGMGRVGQVCSPLIIGLMLALAWAPVHIFAAMATAPLLAGLCVVLQNSLARGATRRGSDRLAARNPAE